MTKEKLEVLKGVIAKWYDEPKDVVGAGLYYTYHDYGDLAQAILDAGLDKKESICDTAPYPECNGAEGCDTCENGTD